MNLNNTVYAVVVTYNGSQWIEKCLSSLKASSDNIHIIVIDNASQDNTNKIIEENFPEVELIKSDKNLGFGQANNLGLKRALQQNTDYVFLLNQDAWVAPDTVEELMKIAKDQPEFGILSPYHFNYEGTETERYFNEWVLKHYTPELSEDQKTAEVKEVYTSSFVHGACWLMPISTVSDVGGFDPLFFHYGEDNDYVQRLQFRGLKVGIVPEVKVFHKGANEGLKKPEENTRFLTNQVLLQLKSPDASDFGAMTLFFSQYFKIRKRGSEFLIVAYRNNFKRILLILRSRKIQKRPLAYLK